MNNKLILPDNSEKEANAPLPNLKVFPGGRDTNWLAELPVGCIFLTRGENDVILQHYEIVAKEGAATLLVADLNDPEMYAWVDTKRFSKAMHLIEILKQELEETDE